MIGRSACFRPSRQEENLRKARTISHAPKKLKLRIIKSMDYVRLNCSNDYLGNRKEELELSTIQSSLSIGF